MSASDLFQRRLAARILAVVGAAWLAAPASGCKSAGGHGAGGAPRADDAGTSRASTSGGGEGGVVDGATGGDAALDGDTLLDAAPDGADDGATGAGGSGEPSSRLCLAWPPAALDTGTGGAGSSDGGDAGLVDAGPMDAGPLDAGDDAGPCPSDQAEVLALFQALRCPRGFEPGTIVSGPLSPATPGECCYEVVLTICGPGGRPYLEGGVALLGPVERLRVADPREASWRAGDRPSVEDLRASDREALASAWAEDALREHASVASFARAALALMAVGAPADLVARTHQAAIDEVRHARLCFMLASAYAGHEIAPGRFPIGDRVSLPTSLVDIAASAAAEGCVGETVAAVLAAEQLAHATDPAVRAALTVIAEDEARHAELAWATVAWAVRAGGDEVRASVARVFSAAVKGAASDERDASVSAALRAHGRLGAAKTSRVAERALARVIAPAASTLGASPESS
jgi:hypothetical protein